MNDYQYLTTKQVAESHRYPFTEGQLRALLIKRDQNGVLEIIRKIGKRVYWRSDLLDRWIESHGPEGDRALNTNGHAT